ncbi:hypothetical protein ACHAWF_012799 [Thalassiosira exigua]
MAMNSRAPSSPGINFYSLKSGSRRRSSKGVAAKSLESRLKELEDFCGSDALSLGALRDKIDPILQILRPGPSSDKGKDQRR